MADEISTAKPGYKTTEFWVTAVCQVIGILGLSGIFTAEQATALTEAIPQIVGAVVMAFSAFGYSISRGSAKKNIN